MSHGVERKEGEKGAYSIEYASPRLFQPCSRLKKSILLRLNNLSFGCWTNIQQATLFNNAQRAKSSGNDQHLQATQNERSRERKRKIRLTNSHSY
jgi:hypothetical protein